MRPGGRFVNYSRGERRRNGCRVTAARQVMMSLPHVPDRDRLPELRLPGGPRRPSRRPGDAGDGRYYSRILSLRSISSVPMYETARAMQTSGIRGLV